MEKGERNKLLAAGLTLASLPLLQACQTERNTEVATTPTPQSTPLIPQDLLVSPEVTSPLSVTVENNPIKENYVVDNDQTIEYYFTENKASDIKKSINAFFTDGSLISVAYTGQNSGLMIKPDMKWYDVDFALNKIPFNQWHGESGATINLKNPLVVLREGTESRDKVILDPWLVWFDAARGKYFLSDYSAAIQDNMLMKGNPPPEIVSVGVRNNGQERGLVKTNPFGQAEFSLLPGNTPFLGSTIMRP